jgi:hypothetical protein
LFRISSSDVIALDATLKSIRNLAHMGTKAHSWYQAC